MPRKYKKNRIYNPNNCSHRVVAQIEDQNGNRIALLAHHAFKWSVYRAVDGRVVITQFSREDARREYAKQKKLFLD